MVCMTDILSHSHAPNIVLSFPNDRDLHCSDCGYRNVLFCHLTIEFFLFRVSTQALIPLGCEYVFVCCETKIKQTLWNCEGLWSCKALPVTTWSDVLSLYFWRAKEADLRLARMINNVSVKLRAAIEEYQLFTQDLRFSWEVVNKDRSIEYLQELVQRDEEMVQRLQALEREVEERADEKMLFIEKLKGNVPFE
ncbi:hypothetical protein Tco_0189330 [Tanacetum coccineum]